MSAPTLSLITSPSLIQSPGCTAAIAAAMRPRRFDDSGVVPSRRAAMAIAATVAAPTPAITRRWAVRRRCAFASSPPVPMIHDAGAATIDVSGGWSADGIARSVTSGSAKPRPSASVVARAE